MNTQHPTIDEQSQYRISSFKGIDVGLGQADPIASISATLEKKYPNHLILVQAGTVFVIFWYALAIPRSFVYSAHKCFKTRTERNVTPIVSGIFYAYSFLYGRGGMVIQDPQGENHSLGSVRVLNTAPTLSLQNGMVDFLKSRRGAIMSNSVLASFDAQDSLVSIQNNVTVTTSNVIAAKFGKRHGDVMRAVKNLECSPEFAERNFALSTHEVVGGKNSVRQESCYIVSRDGFVFLAMGFTGKEAAKWKEQFIDAFNQMEAELLRIKEESRASNENTISQPSMANRRWLISFDHNGNERVQSIDCDESILKWSDIPNVIKDTGSMIDTALLFKIQEACAKRLAHKFELMQYCVDNLKLTKKVTT